MSSTPSSHDRVSSDGTTVYSCPTCFRVELNSYEGWLWHLGSREHQMNHIKALNPFFNPSGPDRHGVFRRCVDVHDILGLKARELLDYFKTWGEIEDFSYWYKNYGEDGKAVRCVVLYCEKESADVCLTDTNHQLENQKIRVAPFKARPERRPGSYDSGLNRGTPKNTRWGESRKRKSSDSTHDDDTETRFKSAHYDR